MSTISIIGMVAAVALLSFMVLKRVNVYVAAIACSIVVALTGQIDLYKALQTNYMGGFGAFVGNMLLVFLAGAFLGEIYNKTNGAKAIARMIVNKMGIQAALIALPVAIGIISYGGIIGYVALFAAYPIALEIFQRADLPRRFIPGVIVFGTCTFSGIGPGSTSGTNLIVQNVLGTPLMAGAVVGFIATAVQLVVGIIWLIKMVNAAKANGEHFEARPTDNFSSDENLPSGTVALIPLIFTLLIINVKIGGKTILPTAFGVFVGCILALALLHKYLSKDAPIMSLAVTGIKNSIDTAGNTGAVVAFGSVVKAASGFPILVDAMRSIPGPPMVAISVASTVIAGVCGSATGGLGIAAPILKEIFTDGMGIDVNILSRMMIIAASGLDTLPHNGFVVSTISLCGETHKDSYLPIFWLSVITPAISIVVAAVLFTLFPNWP